MKVVVVHDYVTQRGGAERVVLDMLHAFPGSRLVTSCYNPQTTYPGFAEHDIETLWVDRVPAMRRDPRRAFPFLADAFDRHVVQDADVVLCSTTGWAHRVGTRAPKIVYCNNPARWLYQPDDYLAGLPRSVRRSFVRATDGMRRTDTAAAAGAAAYLANSSSVAERVRSAYGIEPDVVFPSRSLDPSGPTEPVPGVEPGFLLTIGRSRGYKHTDAVQRAVADLPGRRLVVVGLAPEESDPGAGIIGVHGLSDAQMRWLYTHAVALVAVAHEDFGLTPVEAQAFGLPSVLLRRGGYLDTGVEGVTGVFVEEPTAAAVVDGIRELEVRTWDRVEIRRLGERFSVETFASRIRAVMDRVVGAVGVPAQGAYR